MGHYIIKNKIKIFHLFDEGKRPADIDGFSVSRTTLYQYYAEWRREKGLAGKRTGFAVKKYVHNIKSEKQTEITPQKDSTLVRNDAVSENKKSDRTNLDSFILDCITIIDALKKPRPGAVYLPGSKTERFLADILKIKERGTDKIAFLTMQQYIDLFDKWMSIAREANSRDDFKRISENTGIKYEAPGL